MQVVIVEALPPPKVKREYALPARKMSSKTMLFLLVAHLMRLCDNPVGLI